MVVTLASHHDLQEMTEYEKWLSTVEECRLLATDCAIFYYSWQVMKTVIMGMDV